MILILFQLFLDIYQEHLHIYSFLNKAKNRLLFLGVLLNVFSYSINTTLLLPEYGYPP